MASANHSDKGCCCVEYPYKVELSENTAEQLPKRWVVYIPLR